MWLDAHRLKGVRGDSWRLFRVDVGPLEGRLAIIARRMPALPLTSNGRPHLDWQQGMPLHRFLGLVCRREVESDAVDAKQRSRNIDKMLARLSERAEVTAEEATEKGTNDAVEEGLGRATEKESLAINPRIPGEPAASLDDKMENLLLVKKKKSQPAWADKFQL